MDQQTDSVHITTAYAVDFCESMTLSFKSNHPDTHVSPDTCTHITLSLTHKSKDYVASSCHGVQNVEQAFIVTRASGQCQSCIAHFAQVC